MTDATEDQLWRLQQAEKGARAYLDRLCRRWCGPARLLKIDRRGHRDEAARVSLGA